jgi:ketosteroid isomerase-like protein
VTVSPSNIELLAQAFAGWGKNDPANMRDVLHPDCELVVPDSVPSGGTFLGAESVVGWFTRELWRWFDEFSEGKLIRGRVYADTAVLRDTVEGLRPSGPG